jgi:hypothetical protein
MDSDAQMMERHSRLLARFAEQASSLAEDLHACALSAETPEQKQALSLAFHRMGRTLRQTLALEARLRRDARREDRIDEARADKLAKARVAARRDRVRGAVEALIWDEAEEDEQADYLQLLDGRLEYEDLADPEEPLEVLIQRIAHEIGLPDPPPLGVGAGGEPGGLAAGGRSPEATEGVAAHSDNRSGLQPPQSLRDSSPSGGASDDGDADDYWRSSA